MEQCFSGTAVTRSSRASPGTLPAELLSVDDPGSFLELLSPAGREAFWAASRMPLAVGRRPNVVHGVNTCFAAAMVQLLAHSRHLRAFFRAGLRPCHCSAVCDCWLGVLARHLAAPDDVLPFGRSLPLPELLSADALSRHFGHRENGGYRHGAQTCAHELLYWAQTPHHQNEPYMPAHLLDDAERLAKYSPERWAFLGDPWVRLLQPVGGAFISLPPCPSCGQQADMRTPLRQWTQRAAPGIEPGTSRTQSENHATRPSSQLGLRAP